MKPRKNFLLIGAAAIAIWSALFIAFLGIPKGGPAAPPAPTAAEAAAQLHNDVVSASLYGCEKFLRANSLYNVQEIERSFETTDRLKDPKNEAWVELVYRAGADGRLRWVTCHYARMGPDIVLLDHASGLK